jgi:hypothetical protein
LNRTTLAALLVAALGADGWTRQAEPDDKPLKIVLAPQDAPAHYQAQLLGDLDRPVGEGIKLTGVYMPAAVNDKGALELDVHNDGKPRTMTGKREIVSVTQPGDGEKTKSLTVKLEFHKKEDGAWVYRNLTTLRVQIGAEQFVIVDANGNGAYNDVRADGLTWEGHTWLFPLPSEYERWCSATMEFTGLVLGKMGDAPEVKGKPLATSVPAALALLKGVNDERVEIGLTPRPEDPKLSADLQKHCKYEMQNNTLTHPETPGQPGYTKEGNEAGMRSILSRGTPAEHVAAGMVQTYFHRQDVIRPETQAFGVGYEGNFGGIDGRTNMGKAPAHYWPVLCPVPGQTGVGTTYGKESPDACPGDTASGYPITAYFGTASLKLVSYSLKEVGPAGASPGPVRPVPAGVASIDCYVFDPAQGANNSFSGYQRAVCLISKDPLKSNIEYEVTLKVDVDGKPWTRTWRFSTNAAVARGARRTP